MITAIHRDPFSMSPKVYTMPEGATLADMAKRVTTLPDGWPRHDDDLICINGHPVPRALWHGVRPKPVAGGVPVEVTFHAPPMGGGQGEDGGKNILAVVASIALIAVTSGIASGNILSGLSGKIATGLGVQFSTAASLLAGGVALVGSSLLSALAPTPSLPEPDAAVAQIDRTAAARGNVLDPNAAIPRVVGTMRAFPPFVTEPLTYYDGDDEVVEVLAALAGPHALTDIRVGDALIDDVAGVEYETREGWPGLDPLTLLARYGRTRQLSSELRGHTVTPSDGTQLQSTTGDLADAVPQAKIVTTRSGQDEFWIGINFPQGLFLNSDDTKVMRVPFRLRIRQKGTETWRNLPELHFAAAQVGEKRATIKFVWRDGPVNISAATASGWVEARLTSPAQADPVTDGWTADSYFDADTGNAHYVDASNSGSSDVTNLILSEHVAEFQLDKNEFPRGQYEVEIVRGYAFQSASYAAATYQIASVVRDPFWYETGAARIHQTKDGLADKCYLVRVNSVWNAAPVRKGDTALIAVKARNVSLDSLSVLASGYVRDWDGAAWTNWTTTSNPAPHLRDILAGRLNADPVPEEIIDDTGLVAWRAACVSAGYTCNAVLQEVSVADAARVVAGSGYARLYQSEIWGVVRDYDRSGDDPVQYFSDHNMNNFRWTKAFAKLPEGFRITFFDASEDYAERQIIHPEGAVLTQQETYVGLVSEADVRARADHDLREATGRTTFYTFDAPAEAIKCRRGSLIGVNADVLAATVGSGRITGVEFNASNLVTAITLDNAVPELDANDWATITDLSEVEDMSLIGLRAGAVLRRAGGAASVHAMATTSSGSRIVFSTPFAADGLDVDDLVIVGPVGTEVIRMIVADMQARDDLNWTITAVDEAPEIWT